uniref:Zf-CHCC domain-containing protein n=1 Tax=Anopheles maculatus TaxID=74869 RepID=A0A182SC43_9DIPT
YYEANDYRNARFVNATKVVNPNWAIKLIDEAPIVKSEQRVVCCDGGTDPALGHPKVYINLPRVNSSYIAISLVHNARKGLLLRLRC